jgi:hypothetical protein
MNESNELGKGEAEPDTVVWSREECEEIGPDTGDGANGIGEFFPSLGSVADDE